MTTILVPYDNAMRLGMGFNTYTHALCINDAVQKPGRIPATEDDLSAKDDLSAISQKVTYSSKFVDKVSDVLNSLNISGSLEIKLQSIGAGGQAKASFVDSDKFKDSDLNFLIQVKVVNAKLIADDVTQFCPIDDLPTAQFTEVYGDGFISGFIEGGELNGLISVKLSDRTEAFDIQASLKVNAPLAGGAVDVSGEGDFKMQRDKTEVKGETTVSVSWSGGGDIKGASATDWTVESLKEAAFNFPSRVAQTPQRTYAIITKYTALRTYQELKLQATPLDYDSAGVYTSMLLEAYLEYKTIWKDLQMTAWNLEHKLISLESETPEGTGFADYKACLKKCHDKLVEKYNQDLVTFATMPSELRKLQKPIEPNDVKPYAADLFGLDQARTDCRFEMIKIVRETDAVSYDPKVAIDPDRKHLFLSPTVFRPLLPKAVKAPKIPTDGKPAPPVALFNGKSDDMPKEFLDSLQGHADKFPLYVYSDTAAGKTTPTVPGPYTFSTHLKALTNVSAAPSSFSFYQNAYAGLVGISTHHAVGTGDILTGSNIYSSSPGTSGVATFTVIETGVDNNDTRDRRIFRVTQRGGSDAGGLVYGLGFKQAGPPPKPEWNWGWGRAADNSKPWESRAPEGYSLRGFWTLSAQNKDVLRLGVVWGKD